MVTKAISKEAAEELGKRQVDEQNEIMKELASETRYKFVRVGNLNECWQGYEQMKYYQQNKALLIWRIDGSKIVSDQWDGDEGHWTKTKDTLVNEKKGFWYVVADYI